MLGRSVPSTSGTVIGGAGRVSQISADLPEGADSGRFVVKNAEGVVVFERAFGKQPASTLALEWKGVSAKGEEVPLGLYSVSVDIQRAGVAGAARVTTNELITAVRWDEDASGLVVETETGKEINLAQLQRIGL
jgi:flagellar hook assembly protein FlgD